MIWGYITSQQSNITVYDLTVTHDATVDGNLSVNTMTFPDLAAGPSYDDDAAAAAGGIAISQIYRNGNFLMVRLT